MHFEPENTEERLALAMLIGSAKIETMAKHGDSATAACPLGKHSAEVVVADL